MASMSEPPAPAPALAPAIAPAPTPMLIPETGLLGQLVGRAPAPPEQHLTRSHSDMEDDARNRTRQHSLMPNRPGDDSLPTSTTAECDWWGVLLLAAAHGNARYLVTAVSDSRLLAPLSPTTQRIFATQFRAGQFLLQSEDRVASWLKKAFALNADSPAVLAAVILASLYGHLEATRVLLNTATPRAPVFPGDEAGAGARRSAGTWPRFEPALEVVAFMFAARGGHLHIMEHVQPRVMMVGVPVDGYGSTVVMHAAELGKMAVLEWAVARGASLLQHNRYGNSALMFAACHGDPTLIEWMLSRGCDLNAINDDGDDALLLACRTGKLAAIQFLLARGCSLRRRDNFGDSPFLSASYHGHIEAMEWLLAKGASVDEHNKSGNTALLFACYHGHQDLLQWLLRSGASLTCRNVDGGTPTLLAAQGGHTDVLDFLHSKGLSLHERDGENFTPLLMAAAYGHAECVAWLLDHGALLSDVDSDGNNALLAAAAHGHLTVVTVLHARAVALDARNRNGATALLRAARSKNTMLLDWLVRHGCSFAEKDNAGYTVLLRAAYSGRLAVLVWMLEAGHLDPAFLLHCTTDGRSAPDIAGAKGHVAFAALVSFLAGKSLLQMATVLRLPCVVSRLLAKGHDPACAVALAGPLPLDGGPAVCVRTQDLLRRSLLPWVPARHHLFGSVYRRSVRVLLMLAEKINTETTGVPVLPPELWHLILAFLPRPAVVWTLVPACALVPAMHVTGVPLVLFPATVTFLVGAEASPRRDVADI